MIKFRNCIFVFGLFTLVSSLAFFSPNSGGKAQSEENTIKNAPTSSPIPQKAENAPPSTCKRI
jgi:hypothetical protein